MKHWLQGVLKGIAHFKGSASFKVSKNFWDFIFGVRQKDTSPLPNVWNFTCLYEFLLTAVDEDSAKKLSISYLLSRAVHLLKALQAQPVTVSLDAASWANLRKCDMKRKEHVCRTIFKKISRNLVAHLRPAAYVLVLVGWAALDFVCCSNTRRTSTLCVPDLQNFGQFWNPRTLGGAFLGGLVHHVQHQHRILPTLNWGGIYMHSPIVS